MAWNGSNHAPHSPGKCPAVGASVRPRSKKPAAIRRGIFAAFILALAAVIIVVAFFLLRESPGASETTAPVGPKPIKQSHVTRTEAPPTEPRNSARQARDELNEKVREFITKPLTNGLHFIGEAPLDPKDPDNAMRTQVARDIATLLAIQPGEDVPGCIPMDFMFEDDAIATAKLEGSTVIATDGGNAQFLDNLKKWKVTIKDTDNDAVAAHKTKLIDAQLELLNGIKDGISVNDSIRAAYEFRVRAAEARRSMVEMITELRMEQGENAHDADTLALIGKCNEKLAEEGIMKIDPCEIIEDYEPSETEELKSNEK